MAPLTALAMPVLRRLEAERAHRLAIIAMRLGLAAENPAADPPVLATTVAGLAFTNPIGLAAGFDKDAVALPALMRMGFGFVEAGTVTPRPQAGNPQAAPVPAGGGWRCHKPHGLQQCRRRRLRGPARWHIGPPRARRRQYRRQQGRVRSPSETTRTCSASWRRSRIM